MHVDPSSVPILRFLAGLLLLGALFSVLTGFTYGKIGVISRERDPQIFRRYVVTYACLGVVLVLGLAFPS